MVYQTGQHAVPDGTYVQPAPRKPKRRAGLVAAIVIGALALIGAGMFAGLQLRGDTSSPAVAAPTATTGAPVVQAPVTSAAAPPSASPKMGQEVAWPNGLKLTAFAWKQPAATSAPKPSEGGAPDNYEWGALDVQVCVNEPATLSNQPWYLRYADNTTIEPSSVGYRQFPKPEYVFGERDVESGSCTRGWITFAVPKNVRPTSAVYTNEAGTSAQWTTS